MTLNSEQAKCVEQLKEWTNRQPHLPKDFSANLITRFAHSCYYDLDKAKKTVEMFITIRGNCSDLLTDRDPMSAHMQTTSKIIRIGHITTSNNSLVWLHQINDPGLGNYDYILDAKLLLINSDYHLLNNVDLPETDLVVFDAKYITLKYLTKMNLSAARRLMRYEQDAMPIRLKQVHVVNAPPFIDKIYAVIKPFLSKHVTDLIQFHPPKSETLFKYISKEDLPSDFGGTRHSMSEINEGVVVKLMENREKLIDENLWTVTAKNEAEASTVVGNLRSLVID